MFVWLHHAWIPSQRSVSMHFMCFSYWANQWRLPWVDLNQQFMLLYFKTRMHCLTFTRPPICLHRLCSLRLFWSLGTTPQSMRAVLLCLKSAVILHFLVSHLEPCLWGFSIHLQSDRRWLPSAGLNPWLAWDWLIRRRKMDTADKESHGRLRDSARQYPLKDVVCTSTHSLPSNSRDNTIYYSFRWLFLLFWDFNCFFFNLIIRKLCS